MACPIFRVSGRKLWCLDLRSVGGKKVYFKTEDLAKAAREDKLTEIKNIGTRALSLTQKEKIEFLEARDELAKFGSTISGAVAFYAVHHSELKELSCQQALSEFISTKQATNKSQRYIQQLRYSVSAALSATGRKNLSEIQREDLERWLYSSDFAPRTIRGKRIDLQTFFRFAEQRHWLVKNPAAALENVALEDKPPGILTVDQCSVLLDNCQKLDPEFCGYFSLALFCGVRPEEIQKMQPADIRLSEGYVEVRAKIAKTKKRRLVDIQPAAKAWLQIGISLPLTNFRRRINRVRIAAGFKGFRRFEKKGKPTHEEVDGFIWPQDCLRHSFASYHLAMFGSAEKTSLQMGHRSTGTLFSHYRELVTKKQAEDFWNILPG